jgi:hypothetical protein
VPPAGVDAVIFYQEQGIPLPAVSPSQIVLQYLCQVPHLKSTGSLIISILVADLVFLQVLWKVFNWAVTLTLERRDLKANYCLGCEKRLQAGDCETAVTDPVAHVEADKVPGLQVKTVTSTKIQAESVRQTAMAQVEVVQTGNADTTIPS